MGRESIESSETMSYGSEYRTDINSFLDTNFVARKNLFAELSPDGGNPQVREEPIINAKFLKFQRNNKVSEGSEKYSKDEYLNSTFLPDFFKHGEGLKVAALDYGPAMVNDIVGLINDACNYTSLRSQYKNLKGEQNTNKFLKEHPLFGIIHSLSSRKSIKKLLTGVLDTLVALGTGNATAKQYIDAFASIATVWLPSSLGNLVLYAAKFKKLDKYVNPKVVDLVKYAKEKRGPLSYVYGLRKATDTVTVSGVPLKAYLGNKGIDVNSFADFLDKYEGLATRGNITSRSTTSLGKGVVTEEMKGDIDSTILSNLISEFIKNDLSAT